MSLLDERVAEVAAELAGSMASDRFRYDQTAREDVVRLVLGTLTATTGSPFGRGYVAPAGAVLLDGAVLRSALADGALS